MQQTITRKGSFDSAHRVMNERMKCFHLHGHTYLYALTFSFDTQEEIGYAIDFKEIKRVACQWIDDILDHGAILNPHDVDCIDLCRKLGTKYWLMSLNGEGEYCNPSAENIARELMYAMDILMSGRSCGLNVSKIELWETPNCCTVCDRNSSIKEEFDNFYLANSKSILQYKKDKGCIEYDDRKQ